MLSEGASHICRRSVRSANRHHTSDLPRTIVRRGSSLVRFAVFAFSTNRLATQLCRLWGDRIYGFYIFPTLAAGSSKEFRNRSAALLLASDGRRRRNYAWRSIQRWPKSRGCVTDLRRRTPTITI